MKDKKKEPKGLKQLFKNRRKEKDVYIDFRLVRAEQIERERKKSYVMLGRRR